MDAINSHLADKSYINGYAPSQADVVVLKSLPSAPNKATHPHAARWYSHIASYASEHSTLPGDSTKSVADYVPAIHAQAAITEKAAAAAPPAAAEEEDDDVDLFGSDDEEADAEAERVKQERLKAYAEKKASKPKTIAKSIVTLDVKPWDDETDMALLEKSVRSIEKDGLVWGSSTLIPVGFGIKKLQITLVVEDDKISLEELQEEIEEFEDYVQSTDIAAMAKL